MEEREISLKELIEVVWNGKIIIGILTIVFGIIALAGGMIYDTTTSTVSTVVTLQWDGITAGEYPDGSRFDYTDMIQSLTMEEAVTAAGVTGVTTDQIRSSIKITPIIPSNVIAVIQTALEDGEQISYFATDYKITFDNGALNLDVDEGKAFLTNLLEKFRTDFEKKYIMNSIILDYTGDNISDYDYLDAYSVLQAQIDLIDSAMTSRNELNPGFVSQTLGISFSDILVRTSLLNTIEMEQISSRTNTYLLSKDSDYLITKYTYANVVLQLELDKNVAKEASAQLLVDNYDTSITTILIPGVDPATVLEMNNYYDTLLSNLVNIQNDIAELEQDIAYNELLITRLEANSTLNVEDQARYDAEVVKVEEAIAYTSDELGLIVADSNELLNEYNAYTISNIIRPLTTPQYESSVSVVLYLAIGLVMGGGLGTIVVLFKHDWE